MKKTSIVLALAVVAGAAGSTLAAIQDINGLSITTRNFNDFPTSIGQYQHNADAPVAFPGGAPGHISAGVLSGSHHIDEVISPPGNFANRHLAFFSADGGATPYSFDYTQGFCASARITVRTKNQPWAISTRSIEAGFWAHVPRQDDTSGAPYTDEGGVFAATNGTTFLGGAGLPFSLFGQGGFNDPSNPPFFHGAAVGGGYTEGSMDQTLIYVPPTVSTPAYIRLQATDIVSGVSKDSGWLAIFDSVDMFGDHSGWWNPGTQFGFRFQNAPHQQVVDTEIYHTVSGIKIVPAPGAAALLGLGGLLAARRRR